MKKLKICNLFILLLICILIVIACSKKTDNDENINNETLKLDKDCELYIYTELNGESGYYDNDGNLEGAGIDIVREIQKRLGSNDEIKALSWARAYHELENKKNVALFLTTLTDERKEKFKWVGPILTLEWTFFVKSNSLINCNSLNQARLIDSIGVIRNDIRDKYLTELGFENLDRTRDSKSNIEKLLLGRGDMILSSDVGAYLSLKEIGRDISEIKPLCNIKSFNLYIAFSKKTSNDIVIQWENTFKEIYDDGTFKRILHTYYPNKAIPKFKYMNQ